MKNKKISKRDTRPKENKKNRIRNHLEVLGQLSDNDPKKRIVEYGGTTLVPGSIGTSGKFQVDHVRDLNWYGRDTYSNVWPADSNVNSAFNATNDQYARAQVRKGGKWYTETHGVSFWGGKGKKFYVDKEEYAPDPRGGTPWNRNNPVNSGKDV